MSRVPADPKSWLALLYARSVSPSALDALRAELGSVDDVVGADPDVLLAHGIGDGAISRLRSPDAEQLKRDLTWLEREGRGLLTCDDPRYPALLRALPDAPPALFFVGTPDILALPQLAIVGSRNPTTSGRDAAAAFAHHLAGVGLCIVSGLASGIDAAAHRGALAADGHTVAVCGTGLDTVYPSANRALAIEIAERGLLLSELPVGTPARAHHFPLRNRLISGLAVGTLVVEAARKSGSLITAQRAVEQGRDVFAVPGSIHNPLARGCHQLLREGAKLVESSEDILVELGSLVQAHVSSDQPRGTAEPAFDNDGPAAEDDEEYRQLLNALDFDPVNVDTLIERTALTADAVSSMLLILELQGRVTPVPGGRYVLAGGGDSSS